MAICMSYTLILVQWKSSDFETHKIILLHGVGVTRNTCCSQLETKVAAQKIFSPPVVGC